MSIYNEISDWDYFEWKWDIRGVFHHFKHSDKKLVARIAGQGFREDLLGKKRVLFLGGLYKGKDKHEKLQESIDDLASQTGFCDQWNFMNLLYVVGTKKKHVSRLLKSKTGHDFIEAQLNLAMDNIEFLRPEIIVSCDRLSRQFFFSDDTNNVVGMDYQYTFDNRYGTFVIESFNSRRKRRTNSFSENTSLKGTPLVCIDNFVNQDQEARKQLIWFISNLLTAFQWHAYPLGLGGILNAFQEMKRNEDEWTQIPEFYKRRMKFPDGQREVNRLQTNLEKLHHVLENLQEY